MSQTIDETTLLNNSNNYWELVRRYKQLQQENKQLKEKYNIRSKAYNEVLLENASLKDKADLYKEVIEEVKEFINTACSWLNLDLRDNDELLQVRVLFFKELLEILDKAKEK